MLNFGLDCGLLVFFKYSTYKPESQELPAFLEYGPAEKIRGLCTYNPWSQQGGWLEAFLYEAAQNFEVFSNIQDQN